MRLLDPNPLRRLPQAHPLPAGPVQDPEDVELLQPAQSVAGVGLDDLAEFFVARNRGFSYDAPVVLYGLCPDQAEKSPDSKSPEKMTPQRRNCRSLIEITTTPERASLSSVM